MNILCDQMLGSLASWLRFMGIDTFFAIDQLSDDELLFIAKKEHRILITRDKELIIRAKKQDIPVIAIDTMDLDSQLQTVIPRISFDKTQIMTRCSLCNSILEDIKKEKVKDWVPEKVYRYHHQFFRCPTCEKVYWKGSHYDEIIKKINLLSS